MKVLLLGAALAAAANPATRAPSSPELNPAVRASFDALQADDAPAAATSSGAATNGPTASATPTPPAPASASGVAGASPATDAGAGAAAPADSATSATQGAAAAAGARASGDNSGATATAQAGAASAPQGAEPARLETRARPAPLALKEAPTGPAPWLGAGLLAAAVGTLALLKRRKAQLGGGLRVLESTPLGRNRALVVVEHDGERLLLGVTDGAISVLREARVQAAPQGLPSLPVTPAAPAPARAAVAPAVALFERELEQRIAEEQARRAQRGEDTLDEDAQLRKKLAARARTA